MLDELRGNGLATHIVGARETRCDDDRGERADTQRDLRPDRASRPNENLLERSTAQPRAADNATRAAEQQRK
jgi:hypothetical protein